MKTEIVNLLNDSQTEYVEITFTKKDGSNRVLKAIPYSEVPLLKQPQNPNPVVNENLLKVFELDNDWRVVIVDSIQGYELKKKEQ